MDMKKQFNDFNSSIRLNDSKKAKLKANREALRKKIKNYADENNEDKPMFYSQGSFALDTNINPIKIKENGVPKEKYDLDDGVYFICSESDKKTPDAYHGFIRRAVEGHASEVKDKNTCVRVIYSDGHHIDLPIYWMQSENAIPQLAHKLKGYMLSDPATFGDWVKQKISNTNQQGQLRRIIRYLKAWKNFRETSNSSLRLPSGFILTILVCEHYMKNERDDLALRDTMQSIKNKLDIDFSCYRPTVPIEEVLNEKYSNNKDTILAELEKFLENANGGINSTDTKLASEYWQKIFGDRFPSPDNSGDSKSFHTGVEKPWLEN